MQDGPKATTERKEVTGIPAAAVAGATSATARVGTEPAAPAGPETDIWAGRMSWKYFFGRIVLWVLATTALAIGARWTSSRFQWLAPRTALWIVVAFAGISGLILWIGIAIRVLSLHYRLTSQRLFITRGILSHTVDQTELIRVDDVRLFKSLLGRLMNVGTLTVITTDATDRNITIEGVADPDRVAESIRARMRALRGKSVYVETL